MSIILAIITFLVLLLQTLIDYFIKVPKKKKYISTFILLIGLIVITINTVREKRTEKENTDMIKRQKINLENLVKNTDSLKVINDAIYLKLIIAETEINLLGKETRNNHFDIKEYLSDISENSKERIISEEQSKILASILSNHKGKIKISSVLSDQEAYNYANQIELIFKKAGWQVDGINQELNLDVTKNNLHGLFILTANIKAKGGEYISSPKGSGLVFMALNKAKIKFDWAVRSEITSFEYIELFICKK